MRITHLHIYGYGKFCDKQINFDSTGLQVIYGENEKGKSTIKSFVTVMLFGFPTKSQAGAHYEPKQGASYGGKLTIEMKEVGKVTIERQKGKNNGKAAVYFEDGTVSGEEALHNLLGGIDKRVFLGIFSFSASDLQKMEQLKTEELNQYLHGASIWGKGSLSELEKKIEKGQQELFKPSGKRPILNEKLQQLEEMKKSLKQVESQLNHYNELLVQRRDLQSQYEQISETINLLKGRIKIQEKLKIIEPLYVQETGIVAQLEQLPFIENFPIHGIDAVKDSIAKEQALKEQLVDLELKLSEQEQQTKEGTLRANFEQIKEQALLLKENTYEYERLKEELSSVDLELHKTNQLIADHTERLGRDWNTETVLRAETSLTAKEELKTLVQRERKSLYEQEQLEVELKTKSFQLEQAKGKMKDIHGQCLSIIEKEEIEQELINLKEKRSKRLELEQQIHWQKLQPKSSDHQKKNRFYLILISLLLFGMVGWLVYIQQWIPSILAFVSAAIMLYMNSTVKMSNDQMVHPEIVEQEKKLEHLRTTHELERDIEQLERTLNDNTVKANQLEIRQQQLSQDEKGYHLLLAAIETCENELELIHNQLMEWCRKYQFGHHGNCQHHLELFDLIVDTKQLINDQKYFKKRKSEICERLEEIHSLGQKIAGELFIKENESFAVLVHKIHEVIELEEKSRMQILETNKSVEKLKSEIDTLKKKIQYLQEGRFEWLERGSARAEEEFFYLADIAIERQALNKELVFLRSQQAQIATESLTKEEVVSQLEQGLVTIEEGLVMLNEQLAEAVERQSAHQKQLGKIDHEIEQLEIGTNHSQLCQTYELKKSEFQEVAKEWATLRLGQFILKQAKSIYELERQPVVIQKAKEIFSQMTNGEYTHLFAPISENTFIVERHDGVRFYPDELSQGTGEQLYLSLRLALALEYQVKSPIPIILDDIMVNFDDVRKVNAKSVIEEVAKKHQILFFSCHKQIKNLFQQESTFVLS
ncbi:AAA family ATPase [Alkalihalobacterium sp. APHAB7]|uniref:ATP-binding protein n=1 Tax=Alkalihalobacterium sp. APHAB7 TaxID=3402081 RepID=UPI003AAE2D4A